MASIYGPSAPPQPSPLVPAASIAQQPTKGAPGAQQSINPFRFATVGCTQKYDSFVSANLGANLQPNERSVTSGGFMGVLRLRVYNASAAGATVAFYEDAPYNAIQNLMLRDNVGPYVDVSNGYHAHLLEKYGGYLPRNNEECTDPNVWQKIAGAGTGGGSFNYWLYLPAQLNRRDLIGLLGNQDATQTYRIRADVAPSASIYTTPPSSLTPVSIDYFYDFWAAPNAVSEAGVKNQEIPTTYTVQHYWTEAITANTPAAGMQNLFLTRLGNTIRNLIFVFRANNGSGVLTRATMDPGTLQGAASNFMPTSIQFKVGNQVLFQEDTAAVKERMYRRYGHLGLDAGVLVYDFMTDIQQKAGSELGMDWLWSDAGMQVVMIATFPSGVPSPASCTVLTDEILVPAELRQAVYNP